MLKTGSLSEFLYLWRKSTNYRKCFVSRWVSALFLTCWSSTPKYIAADISTSLNFKKTLESSAFEVAKDMFSFCCLEVFARIRMDIVSIRLLKDLTIFLSVNLFSVKYILQKLTKFTSISKFEITQCRWWFDCMGKEPQIWSSWLHCPIICFLPSRLHSTHF